MYDTYELLTANLPEHLQITLQRTGRTGKNNWAIRRGVPRIVNDRWSGFQDLSKKGVWAEPPHPAVMSYTWIKQYRWDDPNEAVEFWKGYYKKYKKEYDELQKQGSYKHKKRR